MAAWRRGQVYVTKYYKNIHKGVYEDDWIKIKTNGNECNIILVIICYIS